jgi:hypothetical protein
MSGIWTGISRLFRSRELQAPHIPVETVDNNPWHAAQRIAVLRGAAAPQYFLQARLQRRRYGSGRTSSRVRRSDVIRRRTAAVVAHLPSEGHWCPRRSWASLNEADPGAPCLRFGDDYYHLNLKVRAAHRTLARHLPASLSPAFSPPPRSPSRPQVPLPLRHSSAAPPSPTFPPPPPGRRRRRRRRGPVRSGAVNISRQRFSSTFLVNIFLSTLNISWIWVLVSRCMCGKTAETLSSWRCAKHTPSVLTTRVFARVPSTPACWHTQRDVSAHTWVNNVKNCTCSMIASAPARSYTDRAPKL